METGIKKLSSLSTSWHPVHFAHVKKKTCNSRSSLCVIENN